MEIYIEPIQQSELHHKEFKDSVYREFITDFIAGSVGGAISVVVGQPMDTIRVRIQSDTGTKKKGILTHLNRAIKYEGALSLFRGMSSPLTGIPILQAINFGSYSVFKSVFNLKEENGTENPLWKYFVCGSLTGFVQSFICSPIELCKLAVQKDTTQETKCQNNLPKKQNYYQIPELQKKQPVSQKITPEVGSLTVAKYIYSTQGIQGLYRGLLVTFCREIPSYGVYFSSYQWSKTLISKKYKNDNQTEAEQEKIDQVASFISGGLAGVVCWMSTYPFDVIKSRVQMDFEGVKYKGVIDCFKKSLNQEKSIKFLFNGLTATVLRAIPVNAVLFYGYEETVKGLNNMYNKRYQQYQA